MRTAAAAALIALAALAAPAAMRLHASLEQLWSLGPLRRARAADAPVHAPAPAAREAGEATPNEAHAGEAEESAVETEPHALGGFGADEHIARALAANPEFQRAAEELLLDPDPEVRREARKLLRELGALDGR